MYIRKHSYFHIREKLFATYKSVSFFSPANRFKENAAKVYIDYLSMQTFESIKDANDLLQISLDLNYDNLSDLNSSSFTGQCFVVVVIVLSV